MSDSIQQSAPENGASPDPSGYRQTEARLHASEERYRKLFEMMDEGFCIIEMVFDAAGQAV